MNYWRNRFSIAGRVQMINNLLYIPVYIDGVIVQYNRRFMFSKRNAMKLLGAK